MAEPQPQMEREAAERLETRTIVRAELRQEEGESLELTLILDDGSEVMISGWGQTRAGVEALKGDPTIHHGLQIEATTPEEMRELREQVEQMVADDPLDVWHDETYLVDVHRENNRYRVQVRRQDGPGARLVREMGGLERLSEVVKQDFEVQIRG